MFNSIRKVIEELCVQFGLVKNDGICKLSRVTIRHALLLRIYRVGRYIDTCR